MQPDIVAVIQFDRQIEKLEFSSNVHKQELRNLALWMGWLGFYCEWTKQKQQERQKLCYDFLIDWSFLVKNIKTILLKFKEFDEQFSSLRKKRR